jgi:hypothetical protein
VPCEKDKNKLSGSFFHIAFTTPHLLAWSEALRLNKTDERKKYERRTEPILHSVLQEVLFPYEQG